MKIMWITNQIIGSLANKKGLKPITGQWLNAELKREEQLKLSSEQFLEEPQFITTEKKISMPTIISKKEYCN